MVGSQNRLEKGEKKKDDFTYFAGVFKRLEKYWDKAFTVLVSCYCVYNIHRSIWLDNQNINSSALLVIEW